MALLSPTGIETHETGTTNLNAILNGNCEIVNAALAALSGLGGITTITYAASVNLLIETSKPLNQVSLTGNLTIAVTEKAAGLSRFLILIGDGTARTLTWPVGAVWAGDPLTSLPAGATRVVMVMARGTANADLVLCRIGGGSGGGATDVTAPLSPAFADTRGEVGSFCLDGDVLARKVSSAPDPDVWVKWTVSTE